MTDMKRLRKDLPPFAADGYSKPLVSEVSVSPPSKNVRDRWQKRNTPAVVALPIRRTYEAGGFYPSNANDRAAAPKAGSGFFGALSRLLKG